jgi:flagellar basal-body rod protein FlgG
MDSQQKNVDNIANNIANSNTTAFKKGRVDFQDLLYQTIEEAGTPNGENSQTPVGVQIGVGSKVAATHKVFQQGDVNITDNPMDLMINGDGFFAVERHNGEIAFTRNGSLQIDKEGRLTTKEGEILQPPIQIPTNSTAFSINSMGKVHVKVPGSNDSMEAGQINLIQFTNPAGLNAIGGNLYMPTTASGDPVQGIPGENGMGMLMQGALEASNVNVVNEMTNLIKAQRAYELNSKVITSADEMLSNTNSMKR